MAAASLRKVLVVVGSTGAGKTKLSIDLAKAVDGEIINSDAMQMYRGLDIATAKITEQEKEGVPHHLFDVVDPSSRCDVLTFKKLALRTIEDVLARGKVPIIVGGTMYYTQSILWKSQLLDDVDVDAAAASAPLSDTGNNGSEAQEVDHRTPEQLFAKLREVDPVMASRLHVNNVRKVQRSLQVFQQTGIPHSEHIARQEKENLNLEKYFDACAFWVHCNKQTLAARLAKRVDTMISSGLAEEIKTLRAYVKANPPRLNPSVGANDEDNEPENSVGILQAIGYKEFQPYFDALEAQQAASSTGTEHPDDATESATDLKRIFDECVEQLNVATRQYARRQLSWIRNRFVTRNIHVYQVDSSDVSQWDTLVGGPAVHIAQTFLANGVISDSYKSIQESQPEAAKELSLAEKYAENICKICGGRKFTGVKQWASHLASKGHKFHLKRVEIEKNGGGKVQYLRSKQTRAMQFEADNKSEEGEPNCDEAALKRPKVSDGSADGEPSSTTSPV